MYRDMCHSCYEGKPQEPANVRAEDSESITYNYECAHCGYEWWTEWTKEYLRVG